MTGKPTLLRDICLLASGLALACSAEPSEAPSSKLRQGVAVEVAVWTRLALPAVATGRAFHGAVYEPSLESILLFGGRDGDDAGASLDDSGLASGAAWSALSSTYARRGYVRGVFDSARGRVVTYGGLNVALITGVSNYAETWEFDGSASSWARSSSGSLPGRRSGYGLAYDSKRKVTVLFGGYDQSWMDDIHEWNGTAWTKACTTSACKSGPRPSARSLPVLVYDEARGVSLLFGGNGSKGLLDDTWCWDGVGWTLLTPADAPSARHSSAATYDPVSQRVLLFGGAVDDAREAGDFWAWNGDVWSSIAQTTTPLDRRGGALVWDVKRRRGVLLGGASEGQVTDAWTFVLNGSACRETSECHVGACLQGTCSAPPDNEGGGGSGSGSRSGTGGGGGSGGGSGGSFAGSFALGGAPVGGGSGEDQGGQGESGSSAAGPRPGASGEVPTGPSAGGKSIFTPGGLAEGSSGANTWGGSSSVGTPDARDGSGLPPQRSFYACGLGRGGLERSTLPPLALLLPVIWATLGRRRVRRSTA